MSSTLEELAARRAQLVARSDEKRRELAAYYRQFATPVLVTGSVIGLANNLRRSPLFLTVLAAILLRTRWAGVAAVPKLAWQGWKILRFMGGLGR